MKGRPVDKPSLPRGDGQRVLIVAADPELLELLTTVMDLANYRADTVGSGPEMVRRLTEDPCDLLLLDIALPDLGQLRHGRVAIPQDLPPVLFLADPELLSPLMPALDLGEKDYVIKPLRVSEVLVRMQVLLRAHTANRRDSESWYRDLVLDDATCQARRGRMPLDLTPAEYRLLHHLLANSGHVLSKEQISRHVWGEYRADNAIEKLVSRLRGKVDHDAPALIHTHRGFGYWLGSTPG